MRFVLVLGALLAAGALEAQQSSLVGTWHVTYRAGMRVENGMQTPLMATGTLTIEAKGDSLIGTLATEPTDDIPARPPAHLAAHGAGNSATFISRTKAVINVNGSERETTAVSTWNLAATGDSLTGTVERELEGFAMAQIPADNVTGTRKKS